MAEPHSIVVHVREGKVQRVTFCECCPRIELEVRSYEDKATASKTSRRSVKLMFPERQPDGRWRDHEGTYDLEIFEPEEQPVERDPPMRLL